MAKKPIILFKKLSKDAIIPKYAHDTDAGFDLYCLERKTLTTGERYTFQVGISSEIPNGWFVSIRDKSGLAVKAGIHTLAGVIDSGYRGEWGIVLTNLGESECTFEKGDKIAQGILQQATQAEIMEVTELSETERGLGGFGSTGRK